MLSYDKIIYTSLILICAYLLIVAACSSVGAVNLVAILSPIIGY